MCVYVCVCLLSPACRLLRGGGAGRVSLPASPEVHREVSVGLISQNVRVHVLREMALQKASVLLSHSGPQIGSDSCLRVHHPSVANVSAS